MTRSFKFIAPLALAGLATTAIAQEATFAMVDANGDGFLVEAELTAAFGEVGTQLLRYDLDADGRLSAEEMQARNEARAEVEAQGETATGAAETAAEAAGEAVEQAKENAEVEAEASSETEVEAGGADASVDLDAGLSVGVSN